ncbi:MAG: Wzz/FepE/Etk N-terminal domain-containing protein [Candidatus Puniceispirillaceae bacterium]
MSPTNNDEIDLFELFQILWAGKWLISTFTAFFILLGVGYSFSINKAYESKLIYSAGTIPPYYDNDKTFNDFKKMFYSASIFEKWKQSNVNSSIVFEDFSATEVVDGFILSKNEINQLATLKSEKKRGSFVLVRSNQLDILNDFYNYALFISRLLKREYIVRAKDELKIIEARFNDLGAADSSVVDTMLSIDRYIFSAEKWS